MRPRLTVLTLGVDDLERAVAFYRDGLGFPTEGIVGKQFEHGAYAILVIDEGAGVPPSIRDRLFDPFVTTKPGGSGLGLSIVQRAAEAHGGLVTVSALGEETRFTLVLPKFRDPIRT